MGKKIRKLGRRKNYTRRRKVTVRKIAPRRMSDPVIELNISTGYQGVKKVRELLDFHKVTISQKTFKKLEIKPGHLSIKEIQLVLQDPDGIYYKNKDKEECWFFVVGKEKTKKVVVIIEKLDTQHRISTAYILYNNEFQKRVKELQLVWEKQ